MVIRTLTGRINWYRVFALFLVLAFWGTFLVLTWGWATHWKWVLR